MLAYARHSRGWLVLLGLLVGVGVSTAGSVYAQQTSDGGFAISEAGEAAASDSVSLAGKEANTGPVRLARFAFIQGNVTWRVDENSDWSTATVNLPMRQGSQITVSNGGRAEIQFDDGSLLRLGNGAVVTLQTLYSDSDGEFTELKMTAGLASLRLRTDRGVYQINTPLGSLKSAGPAAMRIGVGNGLEVAVQSGKATLEGEQGKADLQGGDFLDLANSLSPYTVRDIPQPDSWDQWNQERDGVLSHAAAEPATAHLPADVAIVAQDLNDYGTWHDDSEDGWVWAPSDTPTNWRPYSDGQWTWVNPFGWTWVSREPWGWAPYHYGTWVAKPYGWAWCPGPVNQYWSPAVVHFSECDGKIAWCPLARREVHYPAAIALGFRGGNWAAYFSIGGAAVYYPTAYGYCVPRLYDTRYVNRVTYVTNLNVLNGNASITRFGFSQQAYAVNNNTVVSGANFFIPINSRAAAGVTAVDSRDFGGSGVYVPVAKADTSLFVRGNAIAAPLGGAAPVAGPTLAKPTPQAMTPTRIFTAAPQVAVASQSRPVYRADVGVAVARNSAPITPTGRVVIPPQTGYIRPTVGQNASANGNRVAAGQAYERGGSNSDRSTGTTAQNPARGQVLPRGNNGQNPAQGQYPGQGHFNANPANGTGGTNSAADAAASARASLGVTNRSTNGAGSDGSGNSDRTTRTPQYNGPNGSGSSGSSPNGSSSNGSAGDRSGPSATPRQPQSAPPQSAPPRSDPPRSNPPAGGGDRTPPASGSGSGSKGSDSTNKGQSGKG